MKKIILLFLIYMTFISCNTGKQAEISGEIKGSKQEKVYLEQQNTANSIIIDSTKINRKGEFKFKIKVTEPSFYNVKVGNESIPLVIEPENKIKIQGEIGLLNRQYTLDGSEPSSLIKILNAEKRKTLKSLDSLEKLYRSLPEEKKFDKQRQQLSNEWDTVFMHQINYSSRFIINYASSPAAYYALYQKLDNNNFILEPINNIYSYKVVLTSMQAFYPESQYTKSLALHYQKIQEEIRSLQLRQFIDNAESSLPEINLPDTKGNNIALSSLNSKLVILDFTILSASEGKEYIKSMQNTYNKLRHKGVEIYQVCLDPNKLTWEKLVKEYDIKWKCVWDSEGIYSNAASSWNIQTVPANYIINNSKKEIVGKNLFAQKLEDRLNDLLR